MRSGFRQLVALVGVVASAMISFVAIANGSIAVWEVAQPDGLARWQRSPVCPLVSGLPAQEGEWILGRVSEIARTAGVPLAGEHCNPNLYILVSNRPAKLLTEMAKRNRAFTFDSAGPSAVNAFIDTRRPVKVWYDTHLADAWGQIPTDARAGMEDVPVVRTIVSRIAPPVNYGISRAFVVVDSTQLQSVSRGQLADYIAMVGLVKFGMRESVGDVQSILTLFDRAAGAAPQGMTDWDIARLKSAYAK